MTAKILPNQEPRLTPEAEAIRQIWADTSEAVRYANDIIANFTKSTITVSPPNNHQPLVPQETIDSKPEVLPINPIETQEPIVNDYFADPIDREPNDHLDHLERARASVQEAFQQSVEGII